MQDNKKKPGNRLWREIAGWGLLALGIAGCLLPIAPGVPFLIAGLAILAHDYVWARRAKTRAKHYARKVKRKISRTDAVASDND